MKTIYRHGDISLHPIKKATGKKAEHNGSFVLSLGTNTGHKHVLSVPKASDMEVRKLADGSMNITLKSDAELSHEEHRKIKVASGIYKTVMEREFDYALNESRQVID